MNLIYNSEQYSVVEFGADVDLEALRFDMPVLKN